MDFKFFGITDKNELHEYKNSEKAFNDNCQYTIMTNSGSLINHKQDILVKFFNKNKPEHGKDTCLLNNIELKINNFTIYRCTSSFDWSKIEYIIWFNNSGRQQNFSEVITGKYQDKELEKKSLSKIFNFLFNLNRFHSFEEFEKHKKVTSEINKIINSIDSDLDIDSIKSKVKSLSELLIKQNN